MKEKRNPLRLYTWLLLCCFIVVEAYIAGTNLFYLIAENDSWRSVIFDFSTSTLLAAFVLITVYYFIKKTFTRLQNSEARYRELADSLPDIVFEMDLEGNLLYVSTAAFQFQGYTNEDLDKGMTVKDVLVDWEKAMDDFKGMIKTNIKTGAKAYKAIKKDGSTAPAIISARLVYDKGKVVGLRGVVTDITEQKRTEEKLKRMNAELDGYAHTVSHDLKNPISNVVFGCGTLQNLLDLPLTDQNITYINEVAEGIINGSVKAAALIDELLLLAESGQVPKEVENVDVDEEVRLIITDKSLEADGVRFNTNDLGAVVASPTHVYQIFSNLIRNAVRLNNSDEPRIDILRLPSEGGSIHRFLVRDNGPGIPEEIIDKIFIPFTKDKERGETGMGLSIVERMVKVYDGDIRAYNDNGACFEFTLKDFTVVFQGGSPLVPTASSSPLSGVSALKSQ